MKSITECKDEGAAVHMLTAVLMSGTERCMLAWDALVACEAAMISI